MYQIFVQSQAEKVLRDLERGQLPRIIEALEELQQKGLRASNVRLLSAQQSIYRKRVGRWRILFTLVERAGKITVWIIEVEKDTKKDYARWIQYIINRL